MWTVNEIWPILVFTAGIVFAAGRVSERVSNGKYTKKEVCQTLHAGLSDQLDRIEQSLEHVRQKLEVGKK